ncbi:uncharacterized protein [Henckelia pumila]|uniref:uncharacterized protein n=1 Tax=Henckelia pumila TaxID=405737 RepID=UPI003C6E8405
MFYALLETYRQATRESITTHTPSETPGSSRWLPPPHGQLRLDVDASFRDEDNRCGVGGVIRTYEGQLLAAFGRTMPRPDSVVIGELLAIHEGLRVVQEQNFQQVTGFSDSLLAVQAVTEPSRDLSYAGLCASEIKALSSLLQIISIFHVRRTDNVVVHSLAKFVVSSPAPFIWVSESFSSWLVNLVTSDITIYE